MHFTHPGNLLLLLIVVPLFVYFFRIKRRNHLRGRLSLALNLATALLLILALSGLQVARGRQHASVVFVVDRSDSVAPAGMSAATEIINRIGSGMAPGDDAGIVVFGKEAVIEQPFQKNLRISEIQSTPEATGTSISKGLSLARGMLTARPESSRRIVLLSDGNQTAGDALRETAMSATEGIAVDVLPLATAAESSGRKLFLQECSSPESVRLGEPFEIRIAFRGNAGADAILQLYRDGALVSARQLKLSGDLEVLRIPVRISAPGFHQYRIKLQDADKARLYDKDESGTVVYSYGRTKVLHLAEKPAGFLDLILKKQGFEVTSSNPRSAPRTVEDFSPYDAVILDNVPAAAFSEDQMRALAEHVERYAGGLVMIGGSGSFGPGGYSGSPVEKALPVEMALRNREKRPALAIVLVLDKSGSMGMEQGKILKLDMAKDAALRLSDLLSPEDNLGIIAFDRSPREVMPLRAGADRITVSASLRTLVAGGGTSILPAVEMAYKWLSSSSAEKKHILLLSDGQAEQAERKPLIERAAGSAVVLSTVGVGSDVDRALLQKLADSGHGRAYFTDTGMELPEIFKREGLLISGKWFVERPFRPRQLAEHEMLQNLGKEGPPEMAGYVAATPKKLSEVLLSADNEDPILACWRYGLGKTLVFTSDFSSPWTRRLVNWEHFAGLWTQIIRWSSRGMQSVTMHAHVLEGDGNGTLVMDCFDLEGNFLNNMRVRAQVENPDSSGSDVDMIQTAPGRYEAAFPLHGKGSYLFTVKAKASGAAAEDILHFGFDFSKSREERQPSSDRVLLSKLAETAKGRVLNPGEVSLDRTAPIVVYRDAWQIAAILSLLLFLLGIAKG